MNNPCAFPDQVRLVPWGELDDVAPLGRVALARSKAVTGIGRRWLVRHHADHVKEVVAVIIAVHVHPFGFRNLYTLQNQL